MIGEEKAQYTSQGHNLYKLIYITKKKLKLCIFNNGFKMWLQKETYLGYI